MACNRTKTLLAAFASTMAFTVFAQDETPKPLPLNEVRIFTEVLDRIRAAYVEEIDDETLLENAIRGMLSGLDPHSSYFAGDALQNLEESTTGEFGGLGVEVGREEGYIRIINPLKDTPASRAGIQAGDKITQIDGTPLSELSPDKAAEMMRGAPGSDVTITVLRGEEEPFDLTLTREIITVASVRSRIVEPGFAHIRVAQFRVNSATEFEDEIAELIEANGELKGIVLDLRNNPGGVLQAAVGIVDAFITAGKIVYTEGRIEESRQEYYATSANPGGDIPLVVLVNEGSASASEIVAGALQDHGRAIIMGTRTFGKGSVQTVLPLTEERAIKLTTSLYFTPDGRSIQAQGIVPDIQVEEALVTRRNQNRAFVSEADLEGHLENEGGEASDQELAEIAVLGAERVLISDYPLNEAITLLKGLTILKPTAAPISGSFASQ